MYRLTFDPCPDYAAEKLPVDRTTAFPGAEIWAARDGQKVRTAARFLTFPVQLSPRMHHFPDTTEPDTPHDEPDTERPSPVAAAVVAVAGCAGLVVMLLSLWLWLRYL